MLKDTLLAALFLGATALAGSDGPLFPWLNLAGVAVFCLFAMVLRHRPVE
jgi:hypothetical protein